ncbi:hypothetical protein AB5I41_28815 [Sphingomonas sp. MMS24-JH45]
MVMPIHLSNTRERKPGFFQHGGLGEKILKVLVNSRCDTRRTSHPDSMTALRNRYERQQQQVRLLEQVKQ